MNVPFRKVLTTSQNNANSNDVQKFCSNRTPKRSSSGSLRLNVERVFPETASVQTIWTSGLLNGDLAMTTLPRAGELPAPLQPS